MSEIALRASDKLRRVLVSIAVFETSRLLFRHVVGNTALIGEIENGTEVKLSARVAVLVDEVVRNGIVFWHSADQGFKTELECGYCEKNEQGSTYCLSATEVLETLEASIRDEVWESLQAWWDALKGSGTGALHVGDTLFSEVWFQTWFANCDTDTSLDYTTLTACVQTGMLILEQAMDIGRFSTIKPSTIFTPQSLREAVLDDNNEADTDTGLVEYLFVETDANADENVQ